MNKLIELGLIGALCVSANANNNIDINNRTNNIVEEITKTTGDGIPVLMYHHIGYPNDLPDINTNYIVTPENFKAMMLILEKNNFVNISLDEFINRDYSRLEEGDSPYLLTFDDASEGQFTINKTYSIDTTKMSKLEKEIINNLEPSEFSNTVLKKEFGILNPKINKTIDEKSAVGIFKDLNERFSIDYFPIFFVDNVGRKKVKGTYVKEIPFCQEGLVKEKLDYILEHGWTIGCHTNSHHALSKTSDENILNDLNAFMDSIETTHPGLKITSFAYPYGDGAGKEHYQKLIADYSYKTMDFDIAFHAWNGHSKKNSNKFSVPRIETRTGTFYPYILNKSALTISKITPYVLEQQNHVEIPQMPNF